MVGRMPDCVTAFSYQINLLLKDGFCLSMTVVRTIILILVANFALPLIPSCVVTLRKARLYNLNLIKPHFYIVNLEFTGINIIFLNYSQKYRLLILVRNALVNWSLHVGINNIFLISSQKHRLWILIRNTLVLKCTQNLCFEKKYEKYHIFFEKL